VQAHVVGLQQTPGQAAAHVPPQVKTPGGRQAPRVVTEQTPEIASQHLPVQGIGLQVLAKP
jgi:hypothetical protein